MDEVLPVVAQITCWGLFVYKWLILFAVLFTWVSADHYNPVVFHINRVTRPFWEWCGRWLPHSLRSFEAYAALLFIILLQAWIPATLQSLNSFFQHQELATLTSQIGGHFLQGIGILCQSVLTFCMFILIVWFFIAMVNASINNPLVRVVYSLADPLITPLQRYLPRTRYDLSPIVGTAFFFLVNRIFISPLLLYGASLSFPVRLCVL